MVEVCRDGGGMCRGWWRCLGNGGGECREGWRCLEGMVEVCVEVSMG